MRLAELDHARSEGFTAGTAEAHPRPFTGLPRDRAWSAAGLRGLRAGIAPRGRHGSLYPWGKETPCTIQAA